MFSKSVLVINGGGHTVPFSQIDPTRIFREITAGTSFEKDPEMQKHLNGFAGSFLKVVQTKDGEDMIRFYKFFLLTLESLPISASELMTRKTFSGNARTYENSIHKRRGRK